MYFSKDADAIPTFEFPGSTGAGPRQVAPGTGYSKVSSPSNWVISPIALDS